MSFNWAPKQDCFGGTIQLLARPGQVTECFSRFGHRVRMPLHNCHPFESPTCYFLEFPTPLLLNLNGVLLDLMLNPALPLLRGLFTRLSLSSLGHAILCLPPCLWTGLAVLWRMQDCLWGSIVDFCSKHGPESSALNGMHRDVVNF